MGKLDEAKEILKNFGVPLAQQNTISAYTLLALCGLKKRDSWKESTARRLTLSKDIMAFIKEKYNKTYAANSRESFRRQVLHQFVQAGICLHNPDDSNIPTNSSKNNYALSEEALEVIRSYKTKNWKTKLEEFKEIKGTLQAKYGKARIESLIPIQISKKLKIELSAGKHNLVQKSIIEEFAPRFAKDSNLLYIGDTANNHIIFEEEIIKSLNIPIDKHSKLPDIILYLKEKNWIYLIEAVTSHGPISGKRVIELQKLFNNCPVEIIFVTAFPDRAEFRKHLADIAWETEVWIVNEPSHLIHFNGEKFLGPYKS